MVAEAVEAEQITEAEIKFRGRELTDELRDYYGLLVSEGILLSLFRVDQRESPSLCTTSDSLF